VCLYRSAHLAFFGWFAKLVGTGEISPPSVVSHGVPFRFYHPISVQNMNDVSYSLPKVFWPSPLLFILGVPLLAVTSHQYPLRIYELSSHRSSASLSFWVTLCVAGGRP